jgi:hypothetical protein
MSRPVDERAHTAVDVGDIRVRGLGAQARSGEIRRAIASEVSERLASLAAPVDASRPVEIASLKLRLPHTANVEQVARGLAQAIARSLRGQRS